MGETAVMSGAEWLARALAGTEMSHVFFVESTLRRTLLHLSDLGVRPILAHSEKAAAFHNKLAPWADLVSGPRAVEVVNKAFTEFMGPMAGLISGDHINKLGGRIASLQKLSELITRLSKELDGKVESQRFIKLCYSTLFSFR